MKKLYYTLEEATAYLNSDAINLGERGLLPVAYCWQEGVVVGTQHETPTTRNLQKVSVRTEKRLSDKELVNLQKRYRNILTRGEKELSIIPPKPSGKRGKLAKSNAHNLWERLEKHEVAVLLFAKDPHVSFTNNRAERDLRMAKVKQKVSGCFRSSEYAHAYCRISSYLQSMASKGYNPLVAIQIALAGEAHEIWGE